MKYRTILDVASVSDCDAVVVASQHDVEPDAGILPEANATNDGRIGRHEIIVAGRLYAILA
jgi:hypothetical protein